MKAKLPESKWLEGQNWMLTQTYHHHIQNIPHKNTFYLFMEAYMEFENADFGCEKHDKCKIVKNCAI